MSRFRSRRSLCWIAALALGALLLLGAAEEDEEEFDFDKALARISHAIRTNPSRVVGQAIDSCVNRRATAVRLLNSSQYARAERALRYCFEVLKIPEEPPVEMVAGPTMEEIEELAETETEEALALEPDVDRGLEIYRSCAGCHLPEGWGLYDGSVPQIAGQHHKVVIKQLADIRAGNRDAFTMVPYASIERIGGAQSLADVAGYIDTLEISVETTKGPGDDLELGAALYAEHCARCHGPEGEGSNEDFVPRIQAQNYRYMLRQFEWIKTGKRRNADSKMQAQIQDFDERQTRAVLDYVSRLEPPEDLQAPPGWHNPDFAR